MGLAQCWPLEDKYLGSDPLGLFPQALGMENLGRFLATPGPIRSGLKTDPGEDQAGHSALTTVVTMYLLCNKKHTWHGYAYLQCGTMEGTHTWHSNVG